MSSLSSTPGTITVDRTPDSNAAYWSQSDRTVLIGDSIYSGTLTLDEVGGGDFLAPLKRVIFHELVHAKYSDAPPTSWQSAFAAEERAVFFENAIYRFAFGGAERVAHTGGSLTGSSVSAVDYLAGMTLVGDVVSGQEGRFTFSAGTDQIEKHYYAYNSTVTASTPHNYDHYITSTLASSAPLLSPEGSIANGRLADALAGSVVDAAANAFAVAAEAVKSVQDFTLDLTQWGATTSMLWPKLEPHDFQLNQTTARMISAERFADNSFGIAHDYAGPAVVNGSGTPDVLAINGVDLAGAILLGGGGYDRNQVTAANAWDDLLGGAGDDLILAGTSSSAHGNALSGGGGADILIGGPGVDRLLGGDGNDLLVGGAGADIFDGGAGRDIVSYAGALSGVNVDLSLRTGVSDVTTIVGMSIGPVPNDATGDRIGNVEIIIGSAFADTLKGDASGVVLFGGDGDDKFYGGAGDVLIGGAGADSYYLSSSDFRIINHDQYYDTPEYQDASKWKVWHDTYHLDQWLARPVVHIAGLDSDDRIYLDNILLTGAIEISHRDYDEYGYGPSFTIDFDQHSWLPSAATAFPFDDAGDYIQAIRTGSETYDFDPASGTGSISAFDLMWDNEDNLAQVYAGIYVDIVGIGHAAGGISYHYEVNENDYSRGGPWQTLSEYNF